MRYATVNCMTEFPLVSATGYTDPFNQVSLDVRFTAPDGGEQVVPSFWAGEDVWQVRYAPAMAGRYHYRSICSDADNAGLHGQQGELEVRPYEGDNPLYRHGPLRVAASRRHLEHRDGTPFFWLGDTWWHGLTGRFCWPPLPRGSRKSGAGSTPTTPATCAKPWPSWGLRSPSATVR